jgi:Protein of unknown function (DUF2442)
MFLYIVSAQYIDRYKIKVKFNNQSEGIADLSTSLQGKVFEPLQDLTLFQKLAVDAELGTIVWENGADFAPEYLYFLAFQYVPELQDQFHKWGYLPSTAITSRVGIAHHFTKLITVELCGQCPPYNLWLIDVKTAVR